MSRTLRHRVEPALQRHLVGLLEMRSERTFHRLVLRDDGRLVRIAKPTFEDQPGKQVRRGLREGMA